MTVIESSEKELIMLRALAHVGEKEYDDAISCIDIILKLDPDDYLAYFNKAVTYRLANRLAEAQKLLLDLLNKNAYQSGIHHQLGLIALEQGDSDAAIEHFSEEINLNPMDSGSLFELGVTLERKGEYQESLSIFQQAMVFDPENPDIREKVGRCHENLGELQKAIQWYNQALEMNPCERIILNKALLYEKMERRDEEIACYEELIQINPENSLPWLKKGLLLMMNEEYESAASCFRMVVRLSPDNHLPHILLGFLFSIKEAYSDAVSAFAEAKRLYPQDLDIILHYARALGACGRYVEALDQFNTLINACPDDRDANEGIARTYYHMGMWDDALSICRIMREREPDIPIWYLIEARICGWRTDDPETAILILKKGAERHPEDDQFPIVTADLLIHLNQNDEAESVLLIALLHHQGNLRLLSRLALLYLEEKRFEMALPILTQIQLDSPENSHTLYLLGQACENTERFEDALKWYTQALSKDPTDGGIWLSRTRVLVELRMLQEAVLSAVNATSLLDEWFDAWRIRGDVEYETGLLADARMSLSRATSLRPDNLDAWLAFGTVLLDLDENRAACIAFSQALIIDPRSVNARRGKIKTLIALSDLNDALLETDQLIAEHGGVLEDFARKAAVLIELGREEDAKKSLEYAKIALGSEPNALVILAELWKKLSDFSMVELLLQEALEIDPGNSLLWVLKGEFLQEEENYQEAIYCFEQALSFDPDDLQAKSGRDACLKNL